MSSFCCGCWEGLRGSARLVSQTPSSALVIDHDQGDLDDFYENSKSVGKGAYGSVCQVTHKKSKILRCLKTIPKTPFRSKPKVLERFTAEVAIMKRLDHPNIVKLHETFEDRSNVYLILDLCEGGTLFERISAASKFTERQAATVMKQMLSSVSYLHSRHVCHRDIKPDNFIFQSKEDIDRNSLMLIDFGLAIECVPGQQLHMKSGTPSYVAPEVLAGSYNEVADAWSCGVIMYIMLCGKPPFYAESITRLFALIKCGLYAFGDEWALVSEDAKTLVKHLLDKDPTSRFSAQQALNDVWIQDNAPKASQEPLSALVLDSIRGFTAVERFKKMVLQVIATHLNEHEVSNLREHFLSMDSDGDGVLTPKDLRDRLSTAGMNVDELEDILTQADLNGNGTIEYSEFLAAALDQEHYMQHQALWEAFCNFDRNNDGTISIDDLRKVLSDDSLSLYMKAKAAEEVMKELDEDNNGIITFEEFKSALKRK